MYFNRFRLKLIKISMSSNPSSLQNFSLFPCIITIIFCSALIKLKQPPEKNDLYNGIFDPETEKSNTVSKTICTQLYNSFILFRYKLGDNSFR